MSKLLRFKCPNCGTVQDVKGDGPCWKCKTMVSLPTDGVIEIYRMASCRGIGSSMEIFLNGIQLGYLGFDDIIRILEPATAEEMRPL